VNAQCVCSPPIIQCSGACVNASNDPLNCGGCGIVCNSGQCINSSCGQSGCPGSLVLCSGVCTDTQFDPDNCGGCGLECPTGRACRGGRCR
jgi:hypothetical protein